MRLTVIGATGGVGQQIVRQGLERGHEVVAFARSPEKLQVQGEGLSIVQGDIRDQDAVAEAVRGSDAVLSALGMTKGQDPEVFGRGMQHLVDAMETHGVQRLVSISGAGLELEGDEGGLGRWLVRTLLKLFSGDVLEAKEREWEVIQRSDVDWILVRPPMMVDGEHTGAIEASLGAVPGSPRVSKADVAQFMLDQVDRDEWVGEAPFVGGG